MKLPRKSLAGVLITFLSFGPISRATILAKQRLGLVEIGSYGKMRVLAFPSNTFSVVATSPGSVLIGVSREGDALVLARDSNGDWAMSPTWDEVAITTVDGREISKIRSPVRGFTSFTAALSPNRQQVAFSGSCRCKSRYGLHLLRPGSLTTLVATEESSAPESVAWSPNGLRLVYDTAGRIYIYELDRSTTTFLADGDNPTWSPDGEWIAYRNPGGEAELISPDGGRRRSILTGVKLARGLSWSPESQYILFTDNKTHFISLYQTNDGHTEALMRPLDASSESRLRWVRFGDSKPLRAKEDRKRTANPS